MYSFWFIFALAEPEASLPPGEGVARGQSPIKHIKRLKTHSVAL
jgi:hypothetical protein